MADSKKITFSEPTPAPAAPPEDSGPSVVTEAKEEAPKEVPVSSSTAAVSTGSATHQNGAAQGGPPKKEEKRVDIDEHLLSFDDLMSRHKTHFSPTRPLDSKGLDNTEASRRSEQYGPNVLTPPKKKHPIVKYLECLSQLFNLLLILAAILLFILLGIDPVENASNSYVGAILLAVALMNAFIEFYQLQKSAAILESFMNMIPAKCNAIREGQQKQMPAAELVPGDVVFTRLGDKVPADIYVFSASDFKVDNSSLTGESEPQERVAHNTHQNPLEATNLAFNGTLVVSGEAYGVVIRTGDQTVLGQIANLTQGEAKRRSPLSEEIERFVHIISAISISTAIIFFAISMNKDRNLKNALNFAIGILVAWVPQGLPATVTMLLTFAAKRMAQKQVLVKDLQGVETLGAITLLATDKTGTLTRNQMTVTNMWTSLKLLSAAGLSQNLEENEKPFDMNISGVSEILHISSMCSRARFERTDIPIDQRPVIGDATESGLLRFAGQKLSNIDSLLDLYPKAFEIPFNSDTKWHMTIHHKKHPNGSLTMFMKGAPERVLRICGSILVDGVEVPMTEEHRQGFQESYEYMAGKGHRVLAFAQKLLPGGEFPDDFVFDKEAKNYPTKDLCFVGLASLEDPPKHGVREAIGHCREAGIKVMMVTGDHPLTAEAIGRKINLMLSDTKEKLAKRTGRPISSIKEDEYFAIVIHGEKIDSLTDEDWDNIFSKDEIIFARTSPKHKLQIVKRAQALGHIVGVTGDGVNDSPALKKADLGIAMNQSGSDVSKEAAAMILLDDNFASVVQGITEGRLIFQNLKKGIQYVVTHSLPEVIPFILFVVVPIPLALGPLQILAVDLGFELLAALSYAFEPPESKTGLMKLPPRKPVTRESVARLRAREAARVAAGLPAGESDPERASTAQASLGRKIMHTLRRPFTAHFWSERFERPEGEVLVDGGVLMWAYIEAGIIQFIGCLTTFFIVLWAGGNPYDEGRAFRISPWDA
ncbi:hypothetical protein HK102_003144, partial [Quaeritorhiza haematococci]